MPSLPPTLYVGLDGPVLIQSGKVDSFMKAAVAPYAKPFLHWAVSHFRVRWLSRRSPREVFYVADLLGLPGDAVPAAGFRGSRCEAIRTGENFFWVDATLSAEETAWIGAHGASRFLGVDPRVGVTPVHRRALESLALSGPQR